MGDSASRASFPPNSVVWSGPIYRPENGRMNKGFGWIAGSIVGFLTVGVAQAHPHVWVTMKSELVYAADGAVTGVRHAWAFDEMFSTFATQGLETKQKGAFTREDLAPLAQVNIDSLKDFDYFTIAKANGKKALFDGPANYWLDFTDSVLTLHSTLPFKTPARSRGSRCSWAACCSLRARSISHGRRPIRSAARARRRRTHRRRAAASSAGCSPSRLNSIASCPA